MRNIGMSDAQLVEAVRGGDEDALGEIIERYTAYVWVIVWNIVQGKLDEADAKAVVSDAFYTLWKNAAAARPRSLKGYLGSIARSRAVDALRRTRQELPLEDDIVQIPIDGPETEAVKRAEYAALRRAVDSLPEPDRTIFLRRYYLYQTLSEIADTMGLNVNTVKTKLRRGKEILRRALTEGGYFIG